MATHRPKAAASVAGTRVSKLPRAAARPRDAEEAANQSDFAALAIILVRIQTVFWFEFGD